MAAEALELEVLRRGRPHGASFTIHAGVDDIPAQKDALQGWLRSDGWSEGLWPQFSANVRQAGKNRPHHQVQAA